MSKIWFLSGAFLFFSLLAIGQEITETPVEVPATSNSNPTAVSTPPATSNPNPTTVSTPPAATAAPDLASPPPATATPPVTPPPVVAPRKIKAKRAAKKSQPVAEAPTEIPVELFDPNSEPTTPAASARNYEAPRKTPYTSPKSSPNSSKNSLSKSDLPLSIAIKDVRISNEKDTPVIQDSEPAYLDQIKILRQTRTSEDCDPVTVRPINFSITQERINLSAHPANKTYNQKIGLTGVSMNIEDPSGIFLGASSYFASTGKRGGFIGVGINAGYNLLINNTFRLTPSLFVGGAGGAGVDSVGGGWIVRPSLAATLDLKYVWIGGGVSYLTAPQGYLRSTQPFAQISIPYDFMFTNFIFYPKKYPQSPPSQQIADTTFRKYRISPVVKIYDTPGDLKTTTNVSLGKNISLAGVNVEHFMNKHWFFNLEVLGAFSTKVNGYMTLMGGPGFSYEVLEDFYLEPQIKLGMIGGGNTNVAGGVGAEPSLDIVWEVGQHTNFNLGLGYLHSFGGDFNFYTGHLGMGVHFDAHETLNRYDDAYRGFALSTYQQSNWKVALSTSHYFIERDALHDIDVLGLGLRYFLTPWLSIDGTGFWPYLGDASGYAAGTIGPSFEKNIFGPVGVIASLAAGPAAKAKKMPVGTGLVVSVNGGLKVDLNKELSLQATGGFVRYGGGGYANTFTGGLNYAFGLPTYRYN